MCTWCRNVCMACLLVELGIEPALAADTGRIAFSGSVVNPTCSERVSEHGAWHMVDVDPERWHSCEQHAAVHDSAPTTYRASTVTLRSSQADGYQAIAWLRRHQQLSWRTVVQVRTRTYR